MNWRLLLLFGLTLLLCGCESVRDFMLSDGGRMLSDTLTNSVGMMVNDQLAEATNGLMTGDMMSVALQDALAAGLKAHKAGAGWGEILGTAGGAGAGGAGLMWVKGKLAELKAAQPALGAHTSPGGPA